MTLASNHETEGFVDVFRGDLLVSEASEPVKIGRSTTQLRFQQTIDDERQVDFTVRVRDFTDTLVDNNSASAIVFASGKPSVLLIDAVPEEIDNLKWALEEQGIVVQVRPAEDCRQRWLSCSVLIA